MAVLIVFADHLLGWPIGGFVGVDIFFVISGFLITGLLLREHDRTGHISFRGFYLHRARRILPAATVTLAITVVFAWALFTFDRFTRVGLDALAGLLFVSNWRFAAVGTDYFQADGPISPLRHYWSLSVEEQFYFVWPWLLLAALVVVARFAKVTPRRSRIVAGSIIVTLSAASFGWALFQSVDAPLSAYFSTFTRAWELGIGAIVAVSASRLERLHPASRSALAYTGIALMLAGVFLISPATIWPAPGALLPVIGAALFIAAGTGTQARGLWMFTNPVAVFTGNVSYSLYLWHFPVIVFASALFPDRGRIITALIFVVACALAIAQYYAVELPIWKGGSRKGYEKAIRLPAAILGGIALVAPVLVASASAGNTPVPALAPQVFTSSHPNAQTIEAQMRSAIEMTTWPELTPSASLIGPDLKVGAWVDDFCLAGESTSEADPKTTSARCVYGDPSSSNTMVLAGDSVALSYLPALLQGFPTWRIHVLTMQQCPFADVSVEKGDGSDHPACNDWHQWVTSQVAAQRPDLVILSQSETALHRLKGSGTPETVMASGVSRAVRDLAPWSGRVIVLSPPPNIKNIADCYTATSSPTDCISAPSDDYAGTITALNQGVNDADVPSSSFLDLTPLFCSGDVCPVFADGKIMRADTSHLTENYSRHLGDAIHELIQRPK